MFIHIVGRRERLVKVGFLDEQKVIRRPWCNVCDDIIEDDECYVLDKDFPYESCVHRKCMDAELGRLVNYTSWYVREYIENHIKDEIGLSKTPTQECYGFYWED